MQEEQAQKNVKNVAQVSQKYMDKTQVFKSKRKKEFAKALEENPPNRRPIIASEIKARCMYWTNSVLRKQRRKSCRLSKSYWRVSWKPPPGTFTEEKESCDRIE